MKVETFACDQCKTHKKDANHWFRAWQLPDSNGIIILRWDTRNLMFSDVRMTPNIEDAAHLCGASCVSQWVSQHLL